VIQLGIGLTIGIGLAALAAGSLEFILYQVNTGTSACSVSWHWR
jgi:hypothetical protein